MLLLSPIGNFVFLNAPSTRHWFHLLIIVTRHLWYFYIRNSKFNIQLHLHLLRNRLTRHATPRSSTVRLQFGYLLSSAGLKYPKQQLIKHNTGKRLTVHSYVNLYDRCHPLIDLLGWLRSVVPLIIAWMRIQSEMQQFCSSYDPRIYLGFGHLTPFTC